MKVSTEINVRSLGANDYDSLLCEVTSDLTFRGEPAQRELLRRMCSGLSQVVLDRLLGALRAEYATRDEVMPGPTVPFDGLEKLSGDVLRDLFLRTHTALSHRGRYTSDTTIMPAFASGLVNNELVRWWESLDNELVKRGVKRPTPKAEHVSDLDDAEKALAREGQYIKAIKVYRDRTHKGLRDSKGEVDAYVEAFKARLAQRVHEAYVLACR